MTDEKHRNDRVGNAIVSLNVREKGSRRGVTPSRYELFNERENLINDCQLDRTVVRMTVNLIETLCESLILRENSVRPQSFVPVLPLSGIPSFFVYYTGALDGARDVTYHRSVTFCSRKEYEPTTLSHQSTALCDRTQAGVNSQEASLTHSPLILVGLASAFEGS